MQLLRNKTLGVILLLAAIVIAASWPLFNQQMFFTHDFVHGVRIAEMARALRDGHFPVRWSSNFGYGYGMPLFEFYAPLPYYIGAAIYLLGVPLIISAKLLFLLPNVLTAVGAYLLGKKLGGIKGGLLAAAVITLAPYRGMNLFIRGAVSETWGIMALVWVLYATLLTINKNKYGAQILVASMVALCLSHNLTVLIGLPFIALWTAVWIWQESKKNNHAWHINWRVAGQQVFSLLGFHVLAIGIASFYLLPLFIEKDFTKVEAATTGGYFNYQLHFLYIRQLFRTEWGYGGSEWGPNDKLPFFLGYAQYLGLLIGLVATLKVGWRAFYKKEIEHHKHFWILSVVMLSVALSVFMTLGKSQSLWDTATFMKYIQFPWRYYTVVIIFMGIAGALGVQHLPKKWAVGKTALVVMLAIVINWQYFRPEKYLEDAQLLYYDDPIRVQAHMSGILPDYIPKTLAEGIAPPQNLIECNGEKCQNLTVQKSITQRKELELSLSQPASVVASIASYPGWRMQVDGAPYLYSTNTQGLITAQLPAGTHHIVIWFGSTPVRQLADTVSLISSSICLGWIFWKRKKI